MSDTTGADNGADQAKPAADPKPKTSGPVSLIEVKFPDKLTPFVWLAMGAGLLLIAMAVAGFIFGWELKAYGSVLLGAGIAIILAAFGGQATVGGKVFVIAGVAGVAGVLVWYLEHWRGLDHQRAVEKLNAQARQYAVGTIYEVPTGDYSVWLKFAKNVVGSAEHYNRQFSFVAFRDETDSARIASLTLDPRGSEEGPVISIAIPASCIAIGLGGERLDWEMLAVDDGFEVRDRRQGDRVIGRWNGERPDECEVESAGLEGPSWTEWVFGSWKAFAASQNQSTGLVDLQTLKRDLTSNDSYIRRSARDNLSLATPGQVPQMLDMLRDNWSNYRIKLGVAVGLAEMLRRDKGQAQAVLGQLDPADRSLLQALAADPDKTIRIYANEVLADLGLPN